MLERSPSHAHRQRAYRARQRNGRLLVTVELAPEEVDTLHRLGCIDLDRLEDRDALADALHLLLGNISGL
jgi:hypothetical protein